MESRYQELQTLAVLTCHTNMDNLTQNLTLQQLKDNITALQKGGLANDKVQAYVDNYQKDASGNYTLKSSTVPAPVPTPTPQPGILQKVGNTISDLGTGVAKGVASTLAGAAQLGEKAILRPLDKILPGQRITSDNQTAVQDLGINQAIEPTNTAQKVGKFGEQVAEFFIPAGEVAKAGKVLDTLFEGSKIARVATKAALEGAVAGGQTAAQQGEVNKGTAVAGLSSAILAPVMEGLSAISKKMPATLWKNVLDRTPTSIAKNPALESQVADAGLMGTRNQILSQAQKNIQSIEVTLDDILSSQTQKVSGSNIAGYLDDLKKSYSVIPGETASVDTISKIQEEMAAKGDLSLVEANGLKREIYKLISKSYGKGTLEIPAKTEAQKGVARGIKEEIEKLVPEVKDLNARQGIFLQVDKALQRVKNKKPAGVLGSGVGMYDLLLGGFGGLAKGGPAGLALVGTKHAADSAIVRTGAAKLIKLLNDVSPTKKALIYSTLKGLTSQGSQVLKD